MDRCATCPGACPRVVPRLCDLANPAHPDYNPAYRDWIAAGQPSTPGAAAAPQAGPPESARYRAVVRCALRVREGCGCQGAVRCELSGRLVTIAECLACVDGAL